MTEYIEDWIDEWYKIYEMVKYGAVKHSEFSVEDKRNITTSMFIGAGYARRDGVKVLLKHDRIGDESSSDQREQRDEPMDDYYESGKSGQRYYYLDAVPDKCPECGGSIKQVDTEYTPYGLKNQHLLAHCCVQKSCKWRCAVPS